MYIMIKTCHWPLLYIGTCIFKHVTHKCDTTLPEYDAAHPLCCRVLQSVAGCCRVLQGVLHCKYSRLLLHSPRVLWSACLSVDWS